MAIKKDLLGLEVEVVGAMAGHSEEDPSLRQREWTEWIHLDPGP